MMQELHPQEVNYDAWLEQNQAYGTACQELDELKDQLAKLRDQVDSWRNAAKYWKSIALKQPLPRDPHPVGPQPLEKEDVT